MTTIGRAKYAQLGNTSRISISVFTQDFGGVTGIFVPALITQKFIQKRHLLRHINLNTYFNPDDDAVYAAAYEIDLGIVSDHSWLNILSLIMSSPFGIARE
jgi:homoaconitase/3-isopropylmalate dehydratase large subunit